VRTVLALFLASICFAQQPGRVEGRVIAPTGAPVSKATVRLVAANTVAGQPSTAYVEITSSDGRFVAENIVPGRYSATAQRVGYTPTRSRNGAIPPVAFELAAGETKSGIEIRLSPLAVISGMVTDADGDAVPGTQIRVLRYSFSQGHLTLANTSIGNSDDRGMFRIGNVPPGRYYVAATAQGITATVNEIRGPSAQAMNLPTYYPNAADPRGAVAFNVDADEVSNINIRLLRGALYSIKGNFVGPDGGPVSGQITVFPKGGDSAPAGMNSQVRDPGIFQLSGLPSGDYTLVVRGSNVVRPAQPSPLSPNPGVPAQAPGQPLQLSGRVDVTLGNANLENVTIRLTEGAELTGRITIEGGQDLSTMMATRAGADVRLTGQIATLAGGIAGALPQAAPSRMPSVLVTSIEGPAAQLMGTANPDGTFRISNVPPLKRVLQVSPLPPNAYIKAIRFGGQDVTRAPLDLSGGAGGVLEILIGTKGAEIAATPRDEKGETPEGGVPVTIWPRTPNPGSPTGDVRILAAAQAGAKLQGFSPGEYYVAAWETATTDYVRVPEFLARFISLATKVTVTEGDSVTVEPRIIPKEAIEKETAQFP
jgi:hypothetical protein